jgi:hypothetical protein
MFDFPAIARKYNLKRTTLSRRFKGETGSKKNAVSYALKALTNVEKDVLVRYINDLNARHQEQFINTTMRIKQKVPAGEVEKCKSWLYSPDTDMLQWHKHIFRPSFQTEPLPPLSICSHHQRVPAGGS